MLYFIQQTTIFQMLLVFLCFAYMALVFFEPSHLHPNEMDVQDSYKDYKGSFDYISEMVIISVFGLNFIIELFMIVSIYKYSSAVIHKKKQGLRKVFRILIIENHLNTLTIFLDLILIVDFVCYVSLYPYNMFRFTRLLRPSSIL